MKAKIILFILLVLIGEGSTAVLSGAVNPQIRATLALETVNGGAGQYAAAQSYHLATGALRYLLLLGYLIAGVVIFSPTKTKHEK